MTEVRDCENCVAGGDEAPEPGILRDGTGEGDAWLCDDCHRDWQRDQAEPQQW